MFGDGNRGALGAVYEGREGFDQRVAVVTGVDAVAAGGILHAVACGCAVVDGKGCAAGGGRWGLRERKLDIFGRSRNLTDESEYTRSAQRDCVPHRLWRSDDEQEEAKLGMINDEVTDTTLSTRSLRSE